MTCGESDYSRLLDEADELLDNYPDSALAIVIEVDRTALCSEKELARHSLLLTLSLLKTDPSQLKDSVFSFARDFYGEQTEPSRETMLTHFAMAALWTMHDSIRKAVGEYDIVLSYPEVEGSDLYKGISYLNKASIYAGELMIDKACTSVDNARGFLKRSGNVPKQAHCRLVSGIVHNLDGNYIQAEKDLLEGRKLAAKVKDETLEQDIDVNLAYSYCCQGRHAEAVDLYSRLLQIEESFMSATDILAYSKSLCATDKVKEAFSLCVQFLSDPEMEIRADAFYTMSQIYEKLGDRDKSVAMRDSFLVYENKIVDKVAHSDLHDISPEKELSPVLSSQSTGNGLKWLFAGGLIVLTVAVIVMIVIMRTGRRRNPESPVVAVDENGQTAGDVSFEMLETMLTPHRQIANKCNRYPSVVSGSEGLKAYEREREGYLDKYRNPEYIKELKEELDRQTGNLLSSLESDYGFQDQDIRLLVYEFCGFNYKTIADIIGINSKHCSVLRTRLKKRLENDTNGELTKYSKFVSLIKKRKSKEIDSEG